MCRASISETSLKAESFENFNMNIVVVRALEEETSCLLILDIIYQEDDQYELYEPA